MSNYFDGLIRASGLAGATNPPLAAEHGITEIEVQQDAPPAAIPAASIGDKDEELVSTHSPLMPSEPNARLPSESQDLGQAMVHTALRWITADVESPSALTEIAPERAPPNRAQHLTTNDITPPARPAASQPVAGPIPKVSPLPSEAPVQLRVAPSRHPESTVRLPYRPSGTRQPTAKKKGG